VSTASDLLRLGRAALNNRALAQIVASSGATLPDGTPLWNTDTLLTTELGWLGIKTGHTPSAGFCLLFAARRNWGNGGPVVTVVGAALGQAHMSDAMGAAKASVDAASLGYSTVGEVVPAVAGQLTSAWGGRSPVGLGRMHQVTAIVRRGSRMSLLAVPVPAQPVVHAGDVIGILEGLVNGELVVVWDLTAQRDIAPPPLRWRLTHG
jgi:D-alanyl-D-alanine carboxypeptidase (penicillin-binding protein 5/6)